MGLVPETQEFHVEHATPRQRNLPGRFPFRGSECREICQSPKPPPVDGEPGKPHTWGLFMTPDWFITRAKKLLFALEYGQEYKDAAEKLWEELTQRYPCVTQSAEGCTKPCVSSDSTTGSPDSSQNKSSMSA
jgi:hypothetical protein